MTAEFVVVLLVAMFIVAVIIMYLAYKIYGVVMSLNMGSGAASFGSRVVQQRMDDVVLVDIQPRVGRRHRQCPQEHDERL